MTPAERELLIAMAKCIGWMQAVLRAEHKMKEPRYEDELIAAIGKVTRQ